MRSWKTPRSTVERVTCCRDTRSVRTPAPATNRKATMSTTTIIAIATPNLAGSGRPVGSEAGRRTGRSILAITGSAAGMSAGEVTARTSLTSPRLTLQPAGEHSKLIRIGKSGINKRQQHLLERSSTETLDDALHGGSGSSFSRLHGAIYERAAHYRVRDVALLFQATQYSADRRVLQLPRDVIPHSGRSHFSMFPQNREELMLEVAEGCSRALHTVTSGNVLLLVTSSEANSKQLEYLVPSEGNWVFPISASVPAAGRPSECRLSGFRLAG